MVHVPLRVMVFPCMDSIHFNMRHAALSLPLDGLVQLVDDGLQHGLVGRAVGSVKTGREQREGRALSVSAGLRENHTHTHTLG